MEAQNKHSLKNTKNIKKLHKIHNSLKNKTIPTINTNSTILTNSSNSISIPKLTQVNLSTLSTNITSNSTNIPLSSQPNKEELEPTLSFPNPKTTAINLYSIVYDMTIFKCQEGIDMGKKIDKIVISYVNKAYPTNNTNLLKRFKTNTNSFLFYSLNQIINSFAEVLDTNCISYLKSNIRYFRRAIFLLTLK